MIVVRLFGKLGNQMFQYAAARALAAHWDVPLKLDIRWLGPDRRAFQLDRLPLFSGITDWKDNLRYTWFPFPREPFRPYFWRVARFLSHLYVEPSFSYNSGFWSLGPDRFLFGYFQSEKYFMDHAALIKRDLAYEPDLSLYEPEVIETVKAGETTAIHFRRGDYITHEYTARTIGALPMDYYERATAYVKSRLGRTRFLIFSDDIDWCRDNLKIDGAVYVDKKGQSPLDDLFLASRCDNNILANSSYSWWCAWLNENPGKIVVAPERWFRDETFHNQSGDLIPEGWTRL
jgi:hypothetical protein